jgi:hypothetical protein
MKFKSGEGKTDFVLLPVHLKSNVDGNFRPHREAEAKELVKHLGEISQKWPGEKDIVILGDFNFLVDKGMAVEKAREILVEAMFRDLNANNEGTHIGSGKAPFDRFFVPIQPEFDQSKQRVVREFLKLKNLKDETFTAKYSDHLMIVTEMRVMNDDD